MNPYFKKRYWKNTLRKKWKAWKVSFAAYRKNFSIKSVSKFLIWKLTRKEEKTTLPRFRLLPKISARHFWFALKSPKRPWWVIVTGLTFLSLLLGVPAYFFGYPLLKEYKFHRFNKTARAALHNGDTYTALLTAQAAHLLQPENLSALKTLIETAEESKHPRLFTWQRILAHHPDANFTDRSVYLKSALQNGNLAESKDWFEKISGTIPEIERIYFQCLILSKQGDEGRFNAYRLAYDFLQKHPFSSPLSEFYWDLCLQSNQSYLIEEAIESLTSASKLSTPLSYEALRRLLQFQTGTDTERKAWATKLWKVNKPSLYDAVLCLNAFYGKNKINGVGLLKVLKEEFPGLLEMDGTHRLVQLLNQVGRPQTANELLPDDQNFSDYKEIYFQTIHSALNSRDNTLAQELISFTAPVLSLNERRFFNLLLGQTDPATPALIESQLAEMLSHCSNEELDTVRLFLPFVESPNFLLGFLEEMERRNPHRIGIKYLLATSYHRLGKYKKLQDVVRRTELPDSIADLAGETQTCIQKTLYGLELEKCSSWAELAFSKNPKNQSVRFALALCYLQKKEAGSAQALLSTDFQRPPPLCPTQRLIGALTLHRNQYYELSKQWSPTEHLSLLTDAEKKLLQETLAKTR